jgi:hypothetical protein
MHTHKSSMHYAKADFMHNLAGTELMLCVNFSVGSCKVNPFQGCLGKASLLCSTENRGCKVDIGF